MSRDLSDRATRRLLKLAHERRGQVREDVLDDPEIPDDRIDGIVGAVDDYVREDEYLRLLADAVDVLLDVEEETSQREALGLSSEVSAAVERAVIECEETLSTAIEDRADEVAEQTREGAVEIVLEGVEEASR